MYLNFSYFLLDYKTIQIISNLLLLNYAVCTKF
jgi:hypothetical protein